MGGGEEMFFGLPKAKNHCLSDAVMEKESGRGCKGLITRNEIKTGGHNEENGPT